MHLGPPNNSPPALALMTVPRPTPPNKSNLVKALNNTQQLERASSLGTGNPKVAFELIVRSFNISLLVIAHTTAAPALYIVGQ